MSEQNNDPRERFRKIVRSIIELNRSINHKISGADGNTGHRFANVVLEVMMLGKRGRYQMIEHRLPGPNHTGRERFKNGVRRIIELNRSINHKISGQGGNTGDRFTNVVLEVMLLGRRDRHQVIDPPTLGQSNDSRGRFRHGVGRIIELNRSVSRKISGQESGKGDNFRKGVDEIMNKPPIYHVSSSTGDRIEDHHYTSPLLNYATSVGRLSERYEAVEDSPRPDSQQGKDASVPDQTKDHHYDISRRESGNNEGRLHENHEAPRPPPRLNSTQDLLTRRPAIPPRVISAAKERENSRRRVQPSLSDVQRYEELKTQVRARERRDHVERQRRLRIQAEEEKTDEAIQREKERLRLEHLEQERAEERRNQELERRRKMEHEERRQRIRHEFEMELQERTRRREEQIKRERQGRENRQAFQKTDVRDQMRRDQIERDRQEREDRQALQEAAVRDRMRRDLSRRDQAERDRLERQRRASIPRRPRHSPEVERRHVQGRAGIPQGPRHSPEVERRHLQGRDQQQEKQRMEEQEAKNRRSIRFEQVHVESTQRELRRQRQEGLIRDVDMKTNDSEISSDVASAESLYSIPSLTSGSTLSGVSSQEVLGADEDLALLLLQDGDLMSLYEIALERMEIQKFETNLTKLLGTFAIDLIKEAGNSLQRSAAHFVKERAEYVTSFIIKYYTSSKGEASEQIYDLKMPPTQDMIERYLEQQMHISYQTLAIDSSAASETKNVGQIGREPEFDESQPDMRDRSRLQDLDDASDFILDSSAISNLRENLRRFVFGESDRCAYPQTEASMVDNSDEIARHEDSDLDESMNSDEATVIQLNPPSQQAALAVDSLLRSILPIIKFFAEFLELREKPLRPRYRRIRWTCVRRLLSFD